MMSYQVTAIIRSDLLERVALRLQEIDVRGMTISTVKGVGESASFFSLDRAVGHARLDLFASEEAVEGIVSAIQSSASTDTPGDGIIAIAPVDRVIRIRTGSAIQPQRSAPDSGELRTGESPRVSVLGAVLAILVVIIVLCGFFAPIEHRLHLLSLALLLTVALAVVFSAFRAASRRHDSVSREVSSRESLPDNGPDGPSRQVPS